MSFLTPIFCAIFGRFYEKRIFWSITFKPYIRKSKLLPFLKSEAQIDYLIGEKKVGENFVGEKFSHFSPTNFPNSSLFPDQFLKLKGLS